MTRDEAKAKLWSVLAETFSDGELRRLFKQVVDGTLLPGPTASLAAVAENIAVQALQRGTLPELFEVLATVRPALDWEPLRVPLLRPASRDPFVGGRPERPPLHVIHQPLGEHPDGGWVPRQPWIVEVGKEGFGLDLEAHGLPAAGEHLRTAVELFDWLETVIQCSGLPPRDVVVVLAAQPSDPVLAFDWAEGRPGLSVARAYRSVCWWPVQASRYGARRVSGSAGADRIEAWRKDARSVRVLSDDAARLLLVAEKGVDVFVCGPRACSAGRVTLVSSHRSHPLSVLLPHQDPSAVAELLFGAEDGLPLEAFFDALRGTSDLHYHLVWTDPRFAPTPAHSLRNA